MTNEELAARIRSGTDDGAAAEQLYTDNMGLIRKICRKYAPYAEMDDLMQEAYFSLLEAAQHFEEGHVTKFSTYAVEAIRRGCIRYIQQSGRCDPDTGGNAPAAGRSGEAAGIFSGDSTKRTNRKRNQVFS